MELTKQQLDFCSLQGSVFELSVTKRKTSSPIFVRRFMKSPAACAMDKGELVSGMDPERVLMEVEESFHDCTKGEQYSPSEMYWIGYMYRYICLTRKISSRLLYQWLKPSVLRPLYFSYHTQGEESAFRAICTSIGKREQDFNAQERLKDCLRAQYKDKLR